MFPSSYYPEVTTTLPPKNPNTPAAGPVNTLCPKCGTATSGQSSCCGRGGSWFKKCGDSGDDNFAHTWFEGTTACKPTRKHIVIRLFIACKKKCSVGLSVCASRERSHYALHILRRKPHHAGRRPGEHRVSQMRHSKVRPIQLLQSWRFLVQEVRRFRRR